MLQTKMELKGHSRLLHVYNTSFTFLSESFLQGLNFRISFKGNLLLQTYLQEWRHQLSASLELQVEEKEKSPTCFSARVISEKQIDPRISITLELQN